MSVLATNGTWVHNFLRESKDFKTKFLGAGLRSFKITTPRTIIEEDVLVKWSEDGVNKTVWQITRLKREGEYPLKVFTGEMEDLVFHKRLTVALANAVRKVDDDFIDKEVI